MRTPRVEFMRATSFSHVARAFGVMGITGFSRALQVEHFSCVQKKFFLGVFILATGFASATFLGFMRA